MRGCDFVFHLAANADVRFGADHPRRDLDQNTIATWNVLDAMRSSGFAVSPFPRPGPSTARAPSFPPLRTALPCSDVALRSFEAGGRRPDRCIL